MVMIQIEVAKPQGIGGAERDNCPEAKAAVYGPGNQATTQPWSRSLYCKCQRLVRVTDKGKSPPTHFWSLRTQLHVP